jgi:hypothetical protein
MSRRKLRRQGTRTLCETLRFVHDVNVDVASDKTAKPDERKEAAETAEKARQDGLAWGCTWAERA